MLTYGRKDLANAYGYGDFNIVDQPFGMYEPIVERSP